MPAGTAWSRKLAQTVLVQHLCWVPRASTRDACCTAGLLAVPGAAVPVDGKTPAAHIQARRPGLAARPHSDDAAGRRATRHAASPIDSRLMHTDPEAMRRHILAQRKQEQQLLQQEQQSQAAAAATAAAEAEGLQREQQQEQQEQQPEGKAAEAEEAAVAAGAGPSAPASSAGQEREVLVESTKENLPDAAAAAAATTPGAAADSAAAAAGAKAAKGTLTAIVEQHGGSRLRREGSTQQALAKQAAAAAPEEQPEPPPAADTAEQGGAAAPEAAPPSRQPTEVDHARVGKLQAALVQHTQGLVLDNLESIHAKLSRCASWPGRGAANTLLECSSLLVAGL